LANISVRRLDDATLERLRQRARLHGVSMEAEVRHILQAALAEPARLGDLAVRTFGKAHGIELELPRHAPHPAIDLTP
jgi:plasmid stability protein